MRADSIRLDSVPSALTILCPLLYVLEISISLDSSASSIAAYFELVPNITVITWIRDSIEFQEKMEQGQDSI